MDVSSLFRSDDANASLHPCLRRETSPSLVHRYERSRSPHRSTRYHRSCLWMYPPYSDRTTRTPRFTPVSDGKPLRRLFIGMKGVALLIEVLVTIVRVYGCILLIQIGRRERLASPLSQTGNLSVACSSV